MKTCSKCGVEKPLDGFYRDRRAKDGHRPDCKECNRAIVAAWKRTPAGQEYTREYNRSPNGGKAATKRWRQSTKGKKFFQQHAAKWARENQEQRRAYSAVLNAVRVGHLPQVDTQACVTCGDPAENYHHPSYERPLDVMPLCRPCHVEVHA